MSFIKCSSSFFLLLSSENLKDHFPCFILFIYFKWKINIFSYSTCILFWTVIGLKWNGADCESANTTEKKSQIESNFQSAADTHVAIYIYIFLYVCVCLQSHPHAYRRTMKFNFSSAKRNTVAVLKQFGNFMRTALSRMISQLAHSERNILLHLNRSLKISCFISFLLFLLFWKFARNSA